MNKLCRQISIESPGAVIKDCVFSFDIPIPQVPANGARIRVVCAGACYRSRRFLSVSSSISSVSSADLCEFHAAVSSATTTTNTLSDAIPITCNNTSATNANVNTNVNANANINDCYSTSPVHQGLLDGALFAGFEVAGIVDAIGSEINDNAKQIEIGDRVIIYPFDEATNGYAEYIVVPDLKYLVKIPDLLSLSVAAMLPSGALLAENAVLIAHQHVMKILETRDTCKILIVGTGGLAFWAIRIASHYFDNPNYENKVLITVASIRDEGFVLATQQFHNINVVQWSEDLYENQLIERTIDACNGLVNIVIDFGTTSRSLHRSLKCLKENGIVLINKETADRLMPKFANYVSHKNQVIIPVDNGSIEQLEKLVKLVANGEIEPPPHTVFPIEEASEVVRKLCNSEITGRAILRFTDTQ